MNSENFNRRNYLRANFAPVLGVALGRTGFAAVAVGALSACDAKPVPQSSFVLLDGTRLDSAALLGKVTLVNFWATSCVSCVAEMPALAEIHTELSPKGYDTIAVAMAYDPPAFVLNFAQSRKLPFKVAIDNTGAVAKAWGDVKVTPTSYLVNKRGEIVKTYVGKPDMAAFKAEVLQLLAA